MNKLYSVYYNERDPFNMFEETIPVGNIDQLCNDGFLVLWGGEDISPSIYGQEPIKETSARNKPSIRDSFEMECAKWAIKNKMPIIGVCRGAQLMCALNGGTLVQHVTHHNQGKHPIVTYDGKKLFTNSIHHQMMNLQNTNNVILAQTPYPLSTKYIEEGRKNLNITIEPEIVWFPDTKTLAIQGHPEYLHHTDEFVVYCKSLINNIIEKGTPINDY